MNMIFHHLRKEIRGLLIPLLVWLATVLVMAIPNIAILQPDYDAARKADQYPVFPFAVIVGFIAWVLLLARLVQSEPLLGSTSFWLTRPIPRGVQLLNKAIFFTTFLLLASFVPIAMHAIFFSPDWQLIQQQALTIGAIELGVALVIVWVAAFTPSLLHFAGSLCVGFVGTFFVWVIELQLHAGLDGYRYGTYLALPLVVLPGFFISLFVQHVWRGTALGLRIGLAAIGLGWLAQCIVPPPPFGGISARAKGTAIVNFAPDWSSHITWDHTSIDGPVENTASATFDPADAGTMMWIQGVSATFEPSGGPEVRLDNDAFLYRYGTEDVPNLRPLIEAKLPGISITGETNGEAPNLTVSVFTLPPEVADKWRGKTGKLTLSLKGEVLEFRSLAAIPLNQPSFIARIPSGFVRVKPVHRGDRQLTVWTIAPTRSMSGFGTEFAYLLFDPQQRTGQILEGRSWSSVSSSFSWDDENIGDGENYFPLSGTEPIDRMLLYAFQVVPARNFQTVLTAPDFTMQPPK